MKLCDLDMEIYQCISPMLQTTEVVITDERIAHIQKNHPFDFEKYSQYMEEMIRHPQYILSDPSPNTAVILHEFVAADERFRLILKLSVVGENPSRKNSVITFMKISQKKYKKYLRNKTILYKSE